MVFTTLTFVLFLAIVFALYWLLRERRAQNLLLLGTSYIFYGWWDWRFCSLMLISSAVDYFAGLGMENATSLRRRRLLLALSIFTNLGFLGFFKYFNFFADSAEELLTMLGFQVNPMSLQIILPVGISFYTFQTMSYTIDVYRGKLPATRSVVDFFAYVAFFPQLVAGPIERAVNLLPQFEQPRRFDSPLATDGCRQILWGFFKKMVIADNLAPLVDSAYANPEGTKGVSLIVATVAFAFQIYCDFSGYSDIAVGTAKLFGIRLMRNFAYPYFSQNMTEFWRRWHISLSTWFRDYVYVPLGGSKTSPLRRARNVMVTFIVSGLWHGASWNFVLWGAINGAGLVPAALQSPEKAKRVLKATDTPANTDGFFPRPMTLFRMGSTFCITCLAWVFFRSGSFEQSLLIIKKMILFPLYNAGSPLGAGEGLSTRQMLVLLAIFLLAEWIQRSHPHPLHIGFMPRWLRWTIYTVVFWTIVFLGTMTSSTFIYFQF